MSSPASKVEVAVIEAGLGGRYDATNVIPSKVQVLTGVALDHTRWLGPTVTAIAEEKLAVVRDHAVLVTPELDPEAEAVAERVGGGEARPPGSAQPADPGVPVRAAGAVQRRNFAVASAAAEAFLGRLDPDAVRAAAAEIEIPGRLEIVSSGSAGDPRRRAQPAGGAGRWPRRLPAIVGERPLVRRDRDPRRQGLDRASWSRCSRCSGARGVHARRQPARAAARPRSQSLASKLCGRRVGGGRWTRGTRSQRARDLAGPRGRGDRHRIASSGGRPGPPGWQRTGVNAMTHWHERQDGPRFLHMIGLVAIVVAGVVLVFVGIGFLLGRLFVS